jgi:hypothetical protein
MRAGLPTAVLTVGDSPNIGDAAGQRQSECDRSGARFDQSTKRSDMVRGSDRGGRRHDQAALGRVAVLSTGMDTSQLSD